MNKFILWYANKFREMSNCITLMHFCHTGRQMIEHTKKLVEDKFTTLGGYEHNAEVKYWLLFSCVNTNLKYVLLTFSA